MGGLVILHNPAGRSKSLLNNTLAPHVSCPSLLATMATRRRPESCLLLDENTPLPELQGIPDLPATIMPIEASFWSWHV